MQVEKTNTSYGNWVVRLSATEQKFFHRKKDALAWLAQQNRAAEDLDTFLEDYSNPREEP